MDLTPQGRKNKRSARGFCLGFLKEAKEGRKKETFISWWWCDFRCQHLYSGINSNYCAEKVLPPFTKCKRNAPSISNLIQILMQEQVTAKMVLDCQQMMD